MKKLILALTAALCLSGILGTVQAQTAKPAAAVPVKIGLVDMARVFKEYKKFQSLRDDLKEIMETRMKEAQAIATEAKTISEEIKLLRQGSAEFIAKESRLTELTTQFQTKQKVAQAEYVRKEAEIFEQIYVEARDVIKLYSEHFEYTLVLRFNSQPLDTQSGNPQEIANNLNKLVVYHRAQDDITDAIVEFLNRKFPAPSPKPAPRAAGNTTPGTRTN
ncbi:MAG: OmpH family outer membrane protein [Planctomycetota bacterium]|nr:OmpH family outer membrane protein [Planctomycetota bacterium]MDA1251890.1 OmpH family outer membrane protein [Planctomycetota bacterium]